MKKVLGRLLTLPYRLWMLHLDHYAWCNQCNTIVNGGFGYLEGGKNKFQCMECANKEMIKRNNLAHFEDALSKNKQRNRRVHD